MAHEILFSLSSIFLLIRLIIIVSTTLREKGNIGIGSCRQHGFFILLQ